MVFIFVTRASSSRRRVATLSHILHASPRPAPPLCPVRSTDKGVRAPGQQRRWGGRVLFFVCSILRRRWKEKSKKVIRHVNVTVANEHSILTLSDDGPRILLRLGSNFVRNNQ
jgi:hypothetical protein